MKNPIIKIKRVASAFRERGWPGVRSLLKVALWKSRERRQYQKWIRKYGTVREADRAEMLLAIESFVAKPLISIVLPVYNVDEVWLRKCIDSVCGQIYKNWELCIADDCSTKPHIRKALEEYSAKDPRIEVIYRSVNGHISAASNSALELAKGDFTVLLDHDDELTPDALFWLVNEINSFPDAEMFYSDEDLIDERGRRRDPKFKPDFSRDLLYSLNLVTHLSAYSTELIKRLGGFRIGLEGSQDYDLALRVIEEIPEDRIRHIPRVLYHWRAIATSVAAGQGAKPYAFEKAREALRDHFKRTGVEASVEQTVQTLNRVQYKLPEKLPQVSIILTGRVEDRFAQNSKLIRNMTDYTEFEIVRASEGESSAECLNDGAGRSIGEILCFLEIGIMPLASDWLKEMVGFALQEKIGAVGPKILDKNMTVRNAGLIIGTRTVVSSAHRGLPGDDIGNFFRAALIGNYSAISSQCLVVRRSVFESVGGFDAANLHNHFVTADFCLRLRERGYRIVFTPYAEFLKTDVSTTTKTNGLQMVADYEYFCSRWKSIYERDPFYNPNFSKKGRTFSIGI